MTQTTRASDKKMAIKEQQTIKRKIGMTTYEVALHFSEGSKETVHDKLMRIIVRDCMSKKIS